jgi:hypothetical protein
MGGCPSALKPEAVSISFVANSRAAMQQTQIRLNQTRAEKISSQVAFDCFGLRSLRFSPASDVLTFLCLTLFRLLQSSLKTSKINNARSRLAA